MLHNVMNALLNTILVSVPEEFFLVVMTLIFIKRFDLLDIRMWRQNIKWITIPVLPVAIMINIFRYIIVIPRPMMTIVNLILFYILMVYILRNNSYEFGKKEYRKLLVGFSLSFIIWGILESATVPIILFLMKKPLEFFNQNIMWNLMLSIPSRIFAFILITYLIVKHNNIMKIKVFEVISRNHFLLTSIVSFAIISNIISVYILKLIGTNRILENKMSLIEQMFITMGVIIFPAIILFWMLLLINYLLVKERQIQQTYKNLVIQDDFTSDVEN